MKLEAERQRGGQLDTRLLNAAEAGELELAAGLLRGGKLVAFPTETVYGLGALALDALAVRGIYAAKGRPASNPLIVHVRNTDEARALTTAWPDEARLLAERFWPGPLTLVLPRAAAVPDEVTAGGDTVALRVPAHPVALALLALVKAPLAAPSANRAEHVSPTSAAHVAQDLSGRIDAILDGGACAFGIESTVLWLDPAGRAEPRQLRAGAISRAQLEAALGRRVAAAGAHGARAGSAPGSARRDATGTANHDFPGGAPAASPGQHARHYAPAGTVRLVAAVQLAGTVKSLAQQGHRVGVLACSIAAQSLSADSLAEVTVIYPVSRALAPGRESASAPGSASAPDSAPASAEYARGLYAALRALEERGCDAIVIEAVPATQEWEAVADRLWRAAGR